MPSNQHRESILRQLRAVHADDSARSQCARILAAIQRLGSLTRVGLYVLVRGG